MFANRVLYVLIAALAAAPVCRSGAQRMPAAAQKPPKTVVDFFLLLPHKYFELEPDTPRQRLDWLRRNLGTVDVPHGYLRMPGDGAQISLTVCLFKRTDGSYLAAVGSNDTDDGVSGSFVDYLLPRYGTTIHVKTRAGKPLYDLVWNGSRFRRSRTPRSGPDHAGVRVWGCAGVRVCGCAGV